MELKDTIKLMESDDYKDRLKAEYYQVKIRREKLQKIAPNSPKRYFKYLYDVMSEYMQVLEERAQKEDIKLD